MDGIAIFGLGFVGLPLALTYTMFGKKVYGVDINSEYIKELRQFQTHILENYKGKTINEILKESIEKGLFVPTNSPEEALKNVTNIIVTVGIPIERGTLKKEVFSNAIHTIGKCLKKGDTVLIRSTIPPGTTRNIVKPILEKESNLICCKDFYLAYSSERIAEGKAFEEFQTMPVAVGAMDEESKKRAVKLLSIINKEKIYEASCPEVVEISKLMENSSRDVNIALSNELASLTEALNVDTLEVIEVANTHKRVHLLTPGIGVGGHCIPYSSLYIFDKSDELNLPMKLLHTAREINDRRPLDVLKTIENKLKDLGKEIENSRFAIIGVAMKDNSSDISESPAMRLKDLILQAGGNLLWFDPNVKGNFPLRASNTEEALKDADVVIIPIKQDNIRLSLEKISANAKKGAIIFDARRLIDKESAEKEGFIYITV
ncbi:MAG: nucleotide sugar dehydrogenase [Caldisericaceae bacterium]|nr:nucleotide sugar dehydrogenase [Caldisericaceae bacterium]